MKKTLIIIPAYDESKSIARVINDCRKAEPSYDVIVVNDCSTDETGSVAEGANAKVLNLPINLGIGGAMQTGYWYAFENNYEYAIQVDGDGQHDPAEIKKLMNCMEQTKADLVVGSRFVEEENGYESSTMRRLGIRIFSIVTKVLTGQKVQDATSGFRLANKKVIELFASQYPSDYPEPEVLILLKKKGFKISEVSVRMEQRNFGKSSITPLRSVYYMIKVIISMVMQKIRG